MTNVYVVTAGEYEDYKILRVFAYKEDADSYAERYTQSDSFHDAYVEEWELSPKGFKPRMHTSTTSFLSIPDGLVVRTESRDELSSSEDVKPVGGPRYVSIGHAVVCTLGDADLVPAAHAERVAAAQEEIRNTPPPAPRAPKHKPTAPGIFL